MEHLGLDIHHRNKLGMTLLDKACFKNDLELVEVLIKNGAKVNEKMPNGLSPLYLTTDSSIKDFLMKNGAKKDQVFETGLALITLNKMGKLKELMALINEQNVNSVDHNANTLLHLEILKKSHDLDFIKFLIKNKINVKQRNNKNITALTLATVHGKKDVCQLLLNNGANNFEIPLVKAIEYKRVDILKLLTKEETAKPMSELTKNNLIIKAISINDTDILDELIKAGFADNEKAIADISIKGSGYSDDDLLNGPINLLAQYPKKLLKYSDKCLEYAIEIESPKLFEELLKLGASPEQLKDHIPILHYCIREYESHMPYVDLLIKYGAKINSINRYDETALDIIENLNFASQATLTAKELLLKNGAKTRLYLEKEKH